MTSKEALNRFEHYLKSHNIRYAQDNDDGTDRLTMCYSGYQNCPDQVLESCVWFYDDSMETRVYFDANASGWAKKHTEKHSGLFRFLNFINASVWPRLSDGFGNELYMPSHLYTPRMYMTEDGYYDITLTTVIPLDFYALAPLETEDYATASCPELMDKLSPAIFGIILGEYGVEEAISYVKHNILNEEDEEEID